MVLVIERPPSVNPSTRSRAHAKTPSRTPSYPPATAPYPSRVSPRSPCEFPAAVLREWLEQGRRRRGHAVDELVGGLGPFEGRASSFQVLIQRSSAVLRSSSEQNTPRGRRRRCSSAVSGRSGRRRGPAAGRCRPWGGGPAWPPRSRTARPPLAPAPSPPR